MHERLAQHLPSSYPNDHLPIPRGTWRNLGETRGGVGKSGVLELKMREWKMQEWKMREQTAGVENAGAITYGKPSGKIL